MSPVRVPFCVAAGPPERRALAQTDLATALQTATGDAFELDLAIVDAPRSAQLAGPPGPPPPAVVSAGVVPADFRGYDTILGDVSGAIIGLSVSPEVTMPAWRHRASGWVIAELPAWLATWGAPQRHFLSSECDVVPPDSIPAVRENLETVANDVLARGAIAVVVFNAFAFVARTTPGRDPIQDRLARLALVVVGVSSATGAYVVDVDRVLGYHGARSLGTDWRAEGETAGGLIADELAAVLVDGALGAAGDGLDATAVLGRYRALRTSR